MEAPIARLESDQSELYQTVQSGKIENILLLLNLNLKLDINYRGNHIGADGPPLYGATIENDVSMMKFLLEQKANVDAVQGTGETSLFAACCGGQVETTRLLLDAKADINIADTTGATPLGMACRAPSKAQLVRLLCERKANVNQKGQGGCAPLFQCNMGAPGMGNEAIRAEAVMCATFLIQAKANVNATDNWGCTALIRAARANHTAMLELLVRSGADLTARCELRTAEEEAVRLRSWDVADYLQDEAPRLQRFIWIASKNTNGSAVVAMNRDLLLSGALWPQVVSAVVHAVMGRTSEQQRSEECPHRRISTRGTKRKHTSLHPNHL